MYKMDDDNKQYLLYFIILFFRFHLWCVCYLRRNKQEHILPIIKKNYLINSSYIISLEDNNLDFCKIEEDRTDTIASKLLYCAEQLNNPQIHFRINFPTIF